MIFSNKNTVFYLINSCQSDMKGFFIIVTIGLFISVIILVQILKNLIFKNIDDIAKRNDDIGAYTIILLAVFSVFIIMPAFGLYDNYKMSESIRNMSYKQYTFEGPADINGEYAKIMIGDDEYAYIDNIGYIVYEEDENGKITPVYH